MLSFPIFPFLADIIFVKQGFSAKLFCSFIHYVCLLIKKFLLSTYHMPGIVGGEYREQHRRGPCPYLSSEYK